MRLIVAGLLVGSATIASSRTVSAQSVVNANASSSTPSPRSSLWWLDVGSASVQQPQGESRLVGSIGAGLWYARRTVALAIDGATALAMDSAGASQLSARARIAPRTWTQTDANLTLLGASGLFARGAEAQQTFNWRMLSLQLDAARASVARGDRDFFGDRVASTLSASYGPWRVGGTVRRAHTDDYFLMEASGITLSRVAASYALDDVGGEVSITQPRWSVAYAPIWRRGREATIGRSFGTSVQATWRVAENVQLMGQGGTQLADVIRAVPQARFVGVGVRWMPSQSVIAPTPLRVVEPMSRAVRVGEVMVERDAGKSAITLFIDAPADARVEIAGSFNDWTPIAMTRGGAQFVYRVALPTGTHLIAVRINGSEWRTPLGLVRVADDFGGSAGRVTVP